MAPKAKPKVSKKTKPRAKVAKTQKKKKTTKPKATKAKVHKVVEKKIDGYRVAMNLVEGRTDMKSLPAAHLQAFHKYIDSKDLRDQQFIKRYETLSEGNRILKEFLINHKELTPEQHVVFTYWLANMPKDSPSFKMYADFINRPKFVDVLMLAPPNFDTPEIKTKQYNRRSLPFLKKVFPTNNCISDHEHPNVVPVASAAGIALLDLSAHGYPTMSNSNVIIYLVARNARAGQWHMDNTFAVGDDLWYSNVSKKQIKQVLNECGNRRFVLFLMEIKSARDNYAHANALFIDKKLKTIEWLEPNGSLYATMNEFSESMVPWITEFVLPHLGADYSILTPDTVCPRYKGYEGPRTGGYCVAWSTVLLHSRIANAEYFTIECQELLFSLHSAEELLGLIRRYVNWMDALTPQIKDPETGEFEAAFSARQQEFIKGQQK